MKHHPDDIFEVEARLAARKAHLAKTAREAKETAVRKLVSPAGLIGAAVLGFVAATVLTRPKKVVAAPREEPVQKGKLAGLASLGMTAGMWYLRSRFANPTALANFVLAKIKRDPAAAADAYDEAKTGAAPAGRSAPSAGPSAPSAGRSAPSAGPSVPSAAAPEYAAIPADPAAWPHPSSRDDGRAAQRRPAQMRR